MGGAHFGPGVLQEPEQALAVRQIVGSHEKAAVGQGSAAGEAGQYCGIGDDDCFVREQSAECHGVVSADGYNDVGEPEVIGFQLFAHVFAFAPVDFTLHKRAVDVPEIVGDRDFQETVGIGQRCDERGHPTVVESQRVGLDFGNGVSEKSVLVRVRRTIPGVGIDWGGSG